MNKLRVGLLMGGLSSEREVSINTGKEIFKNIDKLKYKVVCIEWTIEDTWKEYAINSTDKVTKTYDNIIDFFNNVKLDVVFIALHGRNGEDGRLQGFFEMIGMPYTGSGVLSSALGMNKHISKQIFSSNGIDVARSFIYESDTPGLLKIINNDITNSFGYPCIIKPNCSGSSFGVSKVSNYDELEKALKIASDEDLSILAEEYIEGLELSAAVIGDYTSDNLLVLPIIEIIPNNDFFDYECKYVEGRSQEVVPARISCDLETRLCNIVRKIHNIFLCQGYLRIDVLVKNDRIYVLEINTLPGMTSNSLYPKMAKEIGLSFEDLINKIIELGYSRYGK